MSRALRAHWPEYLIEAALLGTFMVWAAAVATLLAATPASAPRALPSPLGAVLGALAALGAGAAGPPLARRALMGAAMGLTAIALIYSPWGRRSGGHMNPAMTLSFLWLGKVAGWDALFYVLAQTIGAAAGVLVAGRWLGGAFTAPPVRYIVTMPGGGGAVVAFVAEAGISSVLMGTVLAVSNSRHARWTGLCAGLLVALYVTFEAPLSGTSMNPARSFASALAAGSWQSFWVYLVAPPLGMLLAAALYVAARGRAAVRCAKLHHGAAGACIFRCGYRAAEGR
ncbi:MAG TPA: aquaporin [Thermoanaerobaculia bacterium]|nr:aquaporin [Thermoanaerobaculia bacterium]